MTRHDTGSFQRNGRTWLALATVIISIVLLVVLLGWGVLSFFQAAGV